jgi:hypothetical protein
MAQAKMVNLNVKETSGVDASAHLIRGFAVMKSADDVSQALASLTAKSKEAPLMEKTTEDRLNEALTALTKAETDAVAKDAEIQELKDAAAATAAAVVEAPAAADVAPVDSEAELIKSAPEPVQKMIAEFQKAAKDATDRADAVAAELQKSKDDAAEAVAINKAKSWSNLSTDAESMGKMLRQLEVAKPELAKSLEDLLVATNEQLKTAGLFTTLGKDAGASGGDAITKLNSLAKARVDSKEFASFEKAFTKVAQENPELVAQYNAEKEAK